MKFKILRETTLSGGGYPASDSAVDKSPCKIFGKPVSRIKKKKKKKKKKKLDKK